MIILYSTVLIWIMNYFFMAAFSTNFSVTNNAHFIHLPIDDLIPYNSFWNIFYMSWFFVFSMVFPLFYLRETKFSLDEFRRFCMTVFFIYCIAYLVYFIFPCNTTVLHKKNFNALCEPFCSGDNALRQVVPIWNAFPSLHIATSWLILRVVQYVTVNNKHRYIILMITFGWFLGLLMSTIGLKYHFCMDLVAGIVLAEVMFQLFYKRLSYPLLVKINSIPPLRLLKIDLSILILVILLTASFGLVSVFCRHL